EIGEKLSHICTGKILEIEKHPDADKLVITKISDGKLTHQIVTGANNIAVGDIVPVSLPGAVLANGMKIKEAKLRGIPSSGMLCSEVELGVSDSASGIWILPEDTPVGIDFIEFASLKDTILDIAILPNRGDCMSMLGLAREVSVLLDTPLKSLNTEVNESDTQLAFELDVQAPNLCPIYTARIIEGVKMNETPLWMKRRLEVSGLRPIDLLVDITNYVLLEMGQPLHAFDFNQVAKKRIVVRESEEKESFITLDEENRSMPVNTVMIADGERAVAIGGIMGGINSGVTAKTQTLLLESAFFHAPSVRQSMTRLHLRTESSIRFEKGVDFKQIERASNRAAHLYQTLADAKIVGPISRQVSTTYKLFEDQCITYSPEAVNHILGTQIDNKKQTTILKTLGFSWTKDNESAVVPSWRIHDNTTLQCLAEEVARQVGFDNIPEKLPLSSAIIKPKSKQLKQSDSLADTFVKQGFYQVNTYPMVSAASLEQLGLTGDLVFKNPMTPEEAILRPDLLPSLLKVLNFNLKRQNDNIRIFEIGKVFSGSADAISEPLHCAALITGGLLPASFFENDKPLRELTFTHLKGIALTLVDTLGVYDISWSPSDKLTLHPIKSAALKSGKTIIGTIGFIHPKLQNQLGIEEQVGYIDLDLTVISSLSPRPKRYRSIPKYPSTRRDIAILAPATLTYSEIEAIIRQKKPKLVKEFYLFDHFQSEKIGADKKSLAIAFVYQDSTQTLSDKQVNQSHDKFCKALTDNLPIEIR
ncbi:MAG: phenylalanyl-tRNA synthetase beta chain, partial [Candidatus Marinamargulisbacteria bacterium]